MPDTLLYAHDLLLLMLLGGWCHGGVGPQEAAASDYAQGPK
jgi:hypothetical protein